MTPPVQACAGCRTPMATRTMIRNRPALQDTHLIHAAKGYCHACYSRARTGTPGGFLDETGASDPACGTIQAFNAHIRAGTRIDPACAGAKREVESVRTPEPADRPEIDGAMYRLNPADSAAARATVCHHVPAGQRGLLYAMLGI